MMHQPDVSRQADKMTTRTCNHLTSLEVLAEPTSKVCDQCVEMGSTWVHLRSCLYCGQVGCCDNSPNRHARRHWEQTEHSLIRSVEPGETWRYCFEDHFLAR